jgi:hypothetical protein
LESFWRGSFRYVGGLWTAPLPIAFGWYTFLAIRREITGGNGALERKAQRASRSRWSSSHEAHILQVK